MVIKIDGNPNVIDFGIQEDATPIHAGDVSSGFGQLTYTVREREDSPRKIDTDTALVHQRLGTFNAKIGALAGDSGVLSVSANSALIKLSKWLVVPPFQGTLQSYLSKIKSLVGLDRNFVADPGVASQIVRAPGYVGNVWEGLKRFLTANQFELFQDGPVFRVRAFRSATVEPVGVISRSWNLDATGSADKVKVNWYDTQGWASNVSIFPVLSEGVFDPLSVNANETLEQEVTIDGSIISVQQPKVVDYVGPEPNLSGTTGLYCVSGTDGKPIEADRWTASGGWLKVELTDNPSVIKIIVKGGSVEEYSPYRIAATAGSSSFYNSLHILGTGFRWTKRSFEMATGAAPSDSEEESVAEIDNQNVMSASQAYTAALLAARTMRGGEGRIDGSAAHISSTPLGYPLGGRVLESNAVYRVASQSVGPAQTNYSLTADTIIDDLDIGPMTVDQFNALYAGDTLMDFGVRPLGR